MKNKVLFLMFISIVTLFFTLTGIAAAQSDARGQVSGLVYEDVNGDGNCINTGVAGENPVVGVPIEFVSSDEATVVNLTTGSDGSYGLVAAGQSIWRVTAKPNASEWTVTSENPLFAPVLPDSGLIQTGINFCVSKGGNATITGSGNAVIILPESGAAAASTLNSGLFITIFAVVGGVFLTLGVAMEYGRRRSSQ